MESIKDNEDNFGCYRNEECRNRARRKSVDNQSFFDVTIELEDSPPKDIFAVQKSSAILTRKFALVPEATTLHDRKRVYSEMTDKFVKINSLKNLYIQKLIKHATLDNFDNLDDFKGSSKIDAMRLYNLLNLTKLDGSAFSKSASKRFELKERARQCANFEAYTVVRNWLVRNENLRVILSFLVYKLENDRKFALKFLTGKRFSSKDLNEIWGELRTNCFGQRQKLSVFYLNNHVYQLRNMFFKNIDFKSSFLCKPQNDIQRIFAEILKDLGASSEFVRVVANGFTKKVKRRVVAVPEDELLNHLLNRYFRKVKWLSNGLVQRIVALRKKIDKTSIQTQTDKRKKLIRQLKRSLNSIKAKLFTVVKTFEFETKKEFKRKRDLQLDGLKAQFKAKLDSYGIDELYQIIENEFDKEIASIYDSKNNYILRRLFKPGFPSIRVLEVSYGSLKDFVKTQIRYKIRDNLKQSFTIDKITSLFINEFERIKQHLYETVSVPTFRNFSLNLITNETFRENYSKYDKNSPEFDANFDIYDFKLSFISHQFIPFRIIDKNDRLRRLLDKGFTPANPTITFKDRKIILNLPFEVKKGQSNPSQERDRDNLGNEMGIDLGLIDLAVVSVWDRERELELARYFIGTRQLFDKKLVERDEVLRWQYQDRFKTAPYDKLSNVKLKLINLRKQVKLLQRKKNNYEQRLLDKGITNFRSKLKWNKVRKELSRCWDKINRLNKQIVNLLGNCLLTIARFWNVSTIKMEELRWVKHSKKRDAGKFMAFWQTHWFFSQVQEAVKFQCDLNGIKFQKVPARDTSQRCSRCGKFGLRVRKQFSCPHCNLKLDSDLNAARSIAKYQKIRTNNTYSVSSV
jgi:transposase